MKLLPSKHLKLVYSILIVCVCFFGGVVCLWLHCFLPKGLQKQASIKSFFQLKAKYTSCNLPKMLFSHPTTTGMEQATPERKQKGLEATKYSFLSCLV